MKKKITYTIFILCFFCYCLPAVANESTQKDPLGPIKETIPNCGEERYNIGIKITSKKDFIEFIKKNPKQNYFLKLDSFRDEPYIPTSNINWNNVEQAIKVSQNEGYTIYSLEYNVGEIYEDSRNRCFGFTLRASSNGYISIYGCCGK